MKQNKSQMEVVILWSPGMHAGSGAPTLDPIKLTRFSFTVLEMSAWKKSQLLLEASTQLSVLWQTPLKHNGSAMLNILWNPLHACTYHYTQQFKQVTWKTTMVSAGRNDTEGSMAPRVAVHSSCTIHKMFVMWGGQHNLITCDGGQTWVTIIHSPCQHFLCPYGQYISGHSVC